MKYILNSQQFKNMTWTMRLLFGRRPAQRALRSRGTRRQSTTTIFMIQDNLRKEARETCPAARAQAECSSKHETDMAEGGAQVVHSLRHRHNGSERHCTLCQLTATEQKALASNAWNKKSRHLLHASLDCKFLRKPTSHIILGPTRYVQI